MAATASLVTSNFVETNDKNSSNTTIENALQYVSSQPMLTDFELSELQPPSTTSGTTTTASFLPLKSQTGNSLGLSGLHNYRKVYNTLRFSVKEFFGVLKCTEWASEGVNGSDT